MRIQRCGLKEHLPRGSVTEAEWRELLCMLEGKGKGGTVDRDLKSQRADN